MKVLWSNNESEEVTWEAEEEMKKNYPELFLEVNYEGVTHFFKGQNAIEIHDIYVIL